MTLMTPNALILSVFLGGLALIVIVGVAAIGAVLLGQPEDAELFDADLYEDEPTEDPL